MILNQIAYRRSDGVEGSLVRAVCRIVDVVVSSGETVLRVEVEVAASHKLIARFVLAGVEAVGSRVEAVAGAARARSRQRKVVDHRLDGRVRCELPKAGERLLERLAFD